MLPLPTAFGFGVVSGMRSTFGLVAVVWATHLDWLHLEGTPLWFFDFAAVRWLITLCGIGEWIADKLPFIPSRTELLPRIARLLSGGVCGAALSLGTGLSSPGAVAISIATGMVGALCGTSGGYQGRRHLVQSIGGRDWPAALLEDAIAVAILLASLRYLNTAHTYDSI